MNRNVNYNLWNGGYVIPSVYNQSVKQRLHYSFCLQSIYEIEAMLFLMFTINLWNRGYVIPYAYNQSVKQAALFLMLTINLWKRGYVIPSVYN